MERGAGGTGLGLATVFGVVKQNNGQIEVESEPGQGTTFRIYLPVVHEEPGGSEKEPEKAIGGNETVLLVEDEAAISALTCSMLSHLGYTVLSASSPAEAVRVAENGQVNLDLLLTDIIMPGMNGRDLSDLLLSTRPEMKCLFMSVIPPR